ncbi:MAG: hypothetical protein AVDCRST_MAG77-4598, partial [uncultured Chloroflexi bacterium]
DDPHARRPVPHGPPGPRGRHASSGAGALRRKGGGRHRRRLRHRPGHRGAVRRGRRCRGHRRLDGGGGNRHRGGRAGARRTRPLRPGGRLQAGGRRAAGARDGGDVRRHRHPGQRRRHRAAQPHRRDHRGRRVGLRAGREPQGHVPRQQVHHPAHPSARGRRGDEHLVRPGVHAAQEQCALRRLQGRGADPVARDGDRLLRRRHPRELRLPRRRLHRSHGKAAGPGRQDARRHPGPLRLAAAGPHRRGGGAGPGHRVSVLRRRQLRGGRHLRLRRRWPAAAL